MYEIKVKTHFAAAHNLKNYKGKCEHLHGHNWNIEAVFAFSTVGKDGMAIDFHEAKAIVVSVVKKLDHSYLNKTSVLKGINPTSENIAKFIFDSVIKKNGNLKSISVWENDTSCATYYKDGNS